MSSKTDEAGLNKKKRHELKPALRFPEFRNAGEWREDDLSKLSACGLSNGVFNDPEKVGKGYKLINVSDMYIDTAINEDNLSLVELSRDEFLKNKVENGDLFFTRSSLVESGIAYSNIYLGDSNDITFDGHLIRFRPNEEVLVSIFTNYLLRTNKVRSQLVARGKTATMTTIGQADVGGVRLLFPHINEQQKIADCLSSIDDRITAETQKLDTLKAHKKGLMQQLFPAEGETLPKLRFPEFQNVEKLKPLSLGEVSEFIDSLHETPKQYVEIGYPMVRVVDVRDSGLDLDICLKVTEDIYKHFTKRHAPKRGDIIFSRVGSCGESTIIDFDEKVCLGQNTVLIKAKENCLYLFYCLNSNLIRKQVDNKVVGSSHKTLSLKDAKAFDIYLPCKEEQQIIADCLSSIDKLTIATDQKIEILKLHKKGLMQQLFPSIEESKK